jgi:uncharacterized protein (DUF427 family)
MTDFPQTIVEVDHVEPVPRRIRATLGGVVVLDTTAAVYVWEWPHYPQYYVPLADVDADVLVDDGQTEQTTRGVARLHTVRVGAITRPGSVRTYTGDVLARLAGTARFDWPAFDAWFEEDEEVFVHPRCPYTRVDAIRSTRSVRVELDGVMLAESRSPVMVFETGLPTATTSTARTSTSPVWSPRRPSPRVPTRVGPAATGRSAWTASSIPTWPGPTTSRPASCCRSPG